MEDKRTNGVVVRPRSGISEEEARDVRARAWTFVFQCWQEKKKAAAHAPSNGPDDGTKIKEDSADASIIPGQSR